MKEHGRPEFNEAKEAEIKNLLNFEIFDEVDDRYDFMNILLTDILDEHAPLKTKKPLACPNPYMNSKLRKTLHYKSMLRNKYYRKGRNKHSWED